MIDKNRENTTKINIHNVFGELRSDLHLDISLQDLFENLIKYREQGLQQTEISVKILPYLLEHYERKDKQDHINTKISKVAWSNENKPEYLPLHEVFSYSLRIGGNREFLKLVKYLKIENKNIKNFILLMQEGYLNNVEGIDLSPTHYIQEEVTETNLEEISALDFTNITHINLNSNIYACSIFKAVMKSKLPKLTHLSLDRSRLDKEAVSNLVKLLSKNLRYLSLAGSGIREKIDSIQDIDFSNIEYLDLSSNFLDEASLPQILRSLKKIQVLKLSGNIIEEGSFQSLQEADLSNLKELDLQGCINKNSITSLPNIQVTRSNLKKLQNLDLKNIHYIDLRNNGLEEDDVLPLKNSLNCIIEV